MKEFDFQRYKKIVEGTQESTKAIARRTVQRLAGCGHTVERICKVCQRDEAWVRAQLKEDQ